MFRKPGESFFALGKNFNAHKLLRALKLQGVVLWGAYGSLLSPVGVPFALPLAVLGYLGLPWAVFLNRI